MSEIKHTPGPWAAYDGQWGDHGDDEGGGFHIIMGPYDGGAAVRSIRLISYADGQYPGYAGYIEAEANARLIAAAPDLDTATAEAWKALAWIANYDSEDKIIARAMATIEAARQKAGTFDYQAMGTAAAEVVERSPASTERR